MEERFVQSEIVVTRLEDEGEALLFHTETGRIHVLNETGVFVWQTCQTGASVAQLLDGISREFSDAPRDEIAADLGAFLSEMTQRGLLVHLNEEERQEINENTLCTP